jgi:ABC-2 type transport system ATP-binding protein
MNAVSAIYDITATVRCEGIGHRYDDRVVLENVSFRVPRGSILGLVGRNGAGKSTLIRILLGLLQPTEGTSWILGESSLALSDASKARLGYVPQQPDALAWMRVGDMLDFVARLYPRWDAGFVRRELARWNLDSQQPLVRLSPGERQRVALIRALAVTPDVLVLDEPAAALDPVARRELLREIVLRAADLGTTVLFSTHLVSDLERVASHVMFLHKHTVVLDSPVEDIPERYARVVVPAEYASRAFPVNGELSRRRRADGSIAVVVTRLPHEPWPIAGNLPEARVDSLGLEDLFIEVTE